MNKRQWINRVSLYTLGMLILAIGINLNTITGFGVSCITAFYYSIYKATPISFAMASFLMYMVMVAGEFILKGKDRDWKDLLQIPFSLVYSVLLGWMEKLFQSLHFEALWQNLLILLLAIVCIGVGTALMIHTRLIIAPPDGLVTTLAWKFDRSNGLFKNIMDTCCVVFACSVDLLAHGKLVSIGFGTLMSMLFVGRTIAVFDRFFKEKVLKASGLQVR